MQVEATVDIKSAHGRLCPSLRTVRRPELSPMEARSRRELEVEGLLKLVPVCAHTATRSLFRDHCLHTSAMSSRQPAKRLPRPAARYWKGKAPKGADALSDSDEEEGLEAQEEQEEGDVNISDVGGGGDEEQEEEEDGLEVRPAVGKRVKGAITVALKDVTVSREGKVIVGGKEESGRTAVELEEGTCSYPWARGGLC